MLHFPEGYTRDLLNLQRQFNDDALAFKESSQILYKVITYTPTFTNLVCCSCGSLGVVSMLNWVKVGSEGWFVISRSRIYIDS